MSRISPRRFFGDSRGHAPVALSGLIALLLSMSAAARQEQPLGEKGQEGEKKAAAAAAVATEPDTKTDKQAEPARESRRRGMRPGGRRPAAKKQAAKEKVAQALPDEWMKPFKWRSIGPANMSGRIVALTVVESKPDHWWAATASGGLLKTTNNGMTFEHQFDREKTVSIGDVAVCQSNPDILWVGTGESNPRNSVSYGNGVYKSVDGGKTWKHMGLDETYQIGSVAIHPDDPDVVFVGALGRLWGENEERGLYKTTDGGETWDKILYVDDKTGVMDIELQPGNPETMLVATYERKRDGFDSNDPIKKWGPGSGIYRSTDGGQSFERVSSGLPTRELGRVDIDFYAKDPSVVYAVVESSSIGEVPETSAYMGIKGQNAEVGARLTEIIDDGPAKEAGLKKGDIVIGVAGKTVHSYDDMIGTIREHQAGETVEIELSRDRKSVKIEVTFTQHPDTIEDKGEDKGGEKGAEAGDDAVAENAVTTVGDQEGDAAKKKEKKPRAPFKSFLGGQAANVQNQQGPDGHENGGIYKSTDGGLSWARINSLNPRPMYFSQIRVDPSDDQHLYVLGISLHRSKDGGETFTSDGLGRAVHVDHHALWINPNDGEQMILGNDGGIYVTNDRMDNWDHLNHVAIGQFYHVTVGPREDYRVYGGLQDNGSWGGPVRSPSGGGPINEDWMSIGGGDGFVCLVDPNDPDLIYYESQNGGLGRRNLRTGDRGFMRARPPKGQKYRFNWKTPFLLSGHNPSIYYTAGNHVFRSWFQGDNLEPISPELTRTDKGSATALAESPLDASVLYVGTNDGALWATTDGGVNWTDLFAGPQAEEQEAEPREPEPAQIAAAHAEHNDEANGNGNGEEGRPSDPISGNWKGQTEGMGPGPSDFTFELKLGKGDSITGSFEGPMGAGEITEGKLDRENSKASFVLEMEMFKIDFAVALEGKRMKGSLDVGGGQFSATFEATMVSAGGRAKESGDGHDWQPIAKLMQTPMWVSSIEASRHANKRVYVTFDGHRSDNDDAHVFVSENHGKTWRSLTDNLPEDCGVTRVLREDLESPDVLYLGTEFGAFVSIDRGTTWTSMNTNLPTVAVHEIAQHRTSGDIVAGTHGRSLWVLNVTALRQFSKERMTEPFHLYETRPVTYWRNEARTGGTVRRFQGEGLENDARIFYSIAGKPRSVSLEILDPMGETVKQFDTERAKGLHSFSWDLRGNSPGQGRRRAPRVSPGTYQVCLTVDNKKVSEPLVVRADPEREGINLWGEEYELLLEQIRIFEGGEDEGAPEEGDDAH